MKKNLKIVLFSCLIGASLAGIFFFNIKEKADAKNRLFMYAFQVGVFKNEQNAINLKREYSYAKIIKDNEYYRVFIGATINNKVILENVFKMKEYNYYIKEIEISEETYKTIEKYDELLAKTSDENKELAIKNILESIKDEL